MKVGTKITRAVLECRKAYCDYSKTVNNMAVLPVKPRVSYEPGIGWRIDGELFTMTSEKVLEQFEICYNYWREEVMRIVNK